MRMNFEEKLSRKDIQEKLQRGLKEIGNQTFNMKEKKMKDLVKQLGSSVKESDVEKGISIYKTKVVKEELQKFLKEKGEEKKD